MKTAMLGFESPHFREHRSWDRRQFTPQLSSESDGDPILGPASGGTGPENEILSR